MATINQEFTSQSLLISADQVLEVTERNKTQRLRENRPVPIHGFATYAKKTGKDTGQKPLEISNRRNRESRQNPRQHWIAAK